MISQTVRDECARFGGHIDTEVSYTILLLEINEALILLNSPCFQEGCFETILIENIQRTLGVNSILSWLGFQEFSQEQ
jgi:hypothetical protein